MGILDRFRLDGKLALVTGSATGLGAASLWRWLRLEHRWRATEIAALRRKPAKDSRRGAQITEFRCRSEQTGRRGFDSYDAVLEAMGPPDILVNNAGTIYREPAEDHDLQAWMTVVQVNLNSVFRL